MALKVKYLFNRCKRSSVNFIQSLTFVGIVIFYSFSMGNISHTKKCLSKSKCIPIEYSTLTNFGFYDKRKNILRVVNNTG